MILIEYKKCSTCKNANKYLKEKNINYQTREITTDTPTIKEIDTWIKKYNIDIKKLFNTSGLVYKNLNLKNKLNNLSYEEKLNLLSSNGMLIKRPIFITENNIFIGFKEEKWQEIKGDKL